MEKPVTRGRPRSEDARRAILRAALELCARDGYADVTMKGIATEAGVGRQTVYRWWPTKADVLMEALRDMASQYLESVVLSGEALADVRLVLGLTFHTLRDVTGPAITGLMADAQHDPKLSDRLQSTVIEPRRRMLHDILVGGIERGELLDSVDPALVVDLLFGTMWYRLLSHHAPVDDQLADELTDVVVRLIGRRRRH